jgi:hypothetical protein
MGASHGFILALSPRTHAMLRSLSRTHTSTRVRHRHPQGGDAQGSKGQGGVERGCIDRRRKERRILPRATQGQVVLESSAYYKWCQAYSPMRTTSGARHIVLCVLLATRSEGLQIPRTPFSMRSVLLKRGVCQCGHAGHYLCEASLPKRCAAACVRVCSPLAYGYTTHVA